ncbi:hypothetical protein BH24GEM3_BH24GEM3_08650 [soil metagenome]
MQNIRRPRSLGKKGFTLIELMIVVVIIGILAALAIPRFSQASARAKEKEGDGILKQYYTIQLAYSAKHGVFATADGTPGLTEVGWERPPQAQNFVLPATFANQTAALCLTKSPATSNHNSRQIDANGVISDC